MAFAHDILSKYEPAVAKKVVDSYVDGGVFKGGDAEAMRRSIYAAIDKYSGVKAGTASTGKLLAQDLPDSVLPRMLQWDKPLSEQPESVQQALLATGDPVITAWSKNGAWPHATGENAYRSLAGGITRGAAESGKVADVSRTLSELGIPGLSYLDAGSRAGGKGTLNHVIWDQGLLDQMVPTPWSP